MKYAVIKVAAKQLLIKPGEWYDINVSNNVKIGEKVTFNNVLLFKKENTIQLGKPFLKEVTIVGEVIKKVKSKKITVLKTKPKKKYTRTKGHREEYTRILIK